MSLAHAPLKPLDLSGAHAPARTHLLPSDLAGVLTHGRHGKPVKSPLIHPDKPGRPGEPNTPHDEQLIEQARKWVGQTFFGTLLKQMRNSPFKSPLFEGGRGGQAWGELYDQHLVDHMSRGVGNKLVAALVRSIENGQKKKDDSARAVAAYLRQSTQGGKAASAPRDESDTHSDRKGDARRAPRQLRRGSAPPSAGSFSNVRAHVASGH